MGRVSRFGQSLYEGDISFDFVGRRKLWYLISLAIVVVAVAGIAIRGFSLGIEFTGGVEFTAKVASNDSATVDRLRQAVVDADVPEAGDPTVITSGTDFVRVQVKAINQTGSGKITSALEAAGANEVSQNSIGPSWGEQVATKALIGLLVFLTLVVLFIWAYFREWRMSVAALVALAHDLIITIGVYSWSGFEVTPATVTGLLTILGYSLYDTVVVFDKVRENTQGVLASTTRTFARQANLAVNQTLVRSINTSITALLPVLALLVVGVAVLGSGPLKDLALALFVGMAAGTYSSICIATPLAVQLRERQREVRVHTERVLERQARAAQEQPAETAAAGASRPVATSGSAKRSQPVRSTRADRSKKGR